LKVGRHVVGDRTETLGTCVQVGRKVGIASGVDRNTTEFRRIDVIRRCRTTIGSGRSFCD
jgi:hypothetical protein